MQMASADLLGFAEFTLNEIMGEHNWTKTKELTAQVKNKDYGTVTVMGLLVVVNYSIFSYFVVGLEYKCPI